MQHKYSTCRHSSFLNYHLYVSIFITNVWLSLTQLNEKVFLCLQHLKKQVQLAITQIMYVSAFATVWVFFTADMNANFSYATQTKTWGSDFWAALMNSPQTTSHQNLRKFHDFQLSRVGESPTSWPLDNDSLMGCFKYWHYWHQQSHSAYKFDLIWVTMHEQK